MVEKRAAVPARVFDAGVGVQTRLVERRAVCGHPAVDQTTGGWRFRSRGGLDIEASAAMSLLGA